MMQKLPQFATALRRSLEHYSIQAFKSDFLAAFVVSLVALPLSMALSIAVGLPPQHGIYTAIVAGIAVPILGGSNWQVSGPTAAFVVILEPIVANFGLRGIIWGGILAGIMLLIMGFSRLGKLINYLPYPVTMGFTTGIAIVLATLSLNDFLGLGIVGLKGEFIEKVILLGSHFSSWNPYTTVVGILTLVLLFTSNLVIKSLPSAIIAILAGTVLSVFFAMNGHDVATIGSQFKFTATLPEFHLPTFREGDLFAFPSISELRILLFPAFTIAILAALESLLSAIIADGMTGTRHDPNAELMGIGIGNVLSALTGGIPATGAIARTATLINNGAKTPIASMLHAVFIMAFVLLLARWIRYIPMASLSALLLHTAYRMSHVKQFIRTLRIAPRSDVIVLLVCFCLTVFVDMAVGVGFGIICAAFLLLKRITELTQVSIDRRDSAPSATAQALPVGTLVYRVRGPLFFATIEKVFDRYTFVHDYIDRFIIDISEVPFIDMTGLVALKTMLGSIAQEGRTVHIVSDVREVSDKIREKIKGEDVENFVQFHSKIEDIPFLS